MINTLSTLSIALALGIGSTAQSIPQCQQSCQQAALTSTGCGAISAPCACDSPYQNAMLNCLAKPSASGGCSYNQIITWMNTVQTQCFLSPPILPPCLNICPLQAQGIANCSSDTDTSCVCGTAYFSSASSCIKSACPDQFQDWNSGHLDLCNGATPSGPISGGSTTTGTSSPSGGTTSGATTGTGTTSRTSTPTTTTTGSAPATSTPSGSGPAKVQLGGAGLAIVALVISAAYELL